MIRVVVVDDEALIRSGFTLILNAADDIEVVAAVSGGQAMAEINRCRPDVVLLDIRMPDIDGLTILKRIRAIPDPPTVAMLTTFDTDEYVTAALRLGAAGFLLKDTDPEHLAHQVRTLTTEGAVLSAKVTRAVVDGYLERAERPEPDPRIARLTSRERDVLVLLAEGLSNGEIAARMYLGIGTVKDHVSALLTKLGVTNRVQAALMAERAGLLESGRGT
jgi:DNA-binding NarL/FixJ family response regulator